MRRFLSAILVSALAVALAAPAWAADREDPYASAPASSATQAPGAIAGFGLPVTCDMPEPPPPYAAAWGVYHGDAGVPAIQLRPFVCELLAQAEKGIVTERSAGAVFVLGHEIAHSYGIQNETGADCIGGSIVRVVAGKLGIPYATRSRLWARTAQIRAQSCAAWAQAGNPWSP